MLYKKVQCTTLTQYDLIQPNKREILKTATSIGWILWWHGDSNNNWTPVWVP